MAQINPELQRLKNLLEANEELMRDAARKYEDLIAAKESLTAAIEAHKVSKKAALKEPTS
jgi:hypothetical protein